MTTPRQILRQLTPEPIKEVLRNGRIWALSRNLDPQGPISLPEDERQASAQISVVVPVHNAPHVTARCLNSLKEFGGRAEVVLVDDGSTDESVKKLLTSVSQKNGWKLIRNEKPRGHSRASEAGVSASTRPYICLLNSDAIVTTKSWAAVVEAFESSEAIAVVGPSTSHTPGPQVVSRAYHCRHHWSDEQIWTFADQYTAQHRNDALVDLPFIGGFAFFVRRTIWDALKGFDQNLPDYGNESELCRRVRAAGLRTVWTSRSYIHHLGNESYGKAIGKEMIARKSLEADAYMRQKFGC
ncbi:MAG: glycosyltransferase family 2 protein [Verrucomicrobiota bacterium]